MSDSHAVKSSRPLICTIPLELRLMIFEVAVKLDKPITPRQITEHSNKFTWGDRKQAPVHNHPGNRDYVWECQEGERLAVVSLNLTCKQFYEELRHYPVFYRVNDFHFEMEDLVPYLAAITPERRDMIQHVTLTGTGGGGGGAAAAASSTKSRRSTALHKHGFALLSQCKGLRHVHPTKAARLSKKGFSCKAVQQAVAFADLDISGSDRPCGFTLSRVEALRQQKMNAVMDFKLGTVKKDLLPRYNADGQLLWRVQEIHSITRDSRDLRCEVRWWNNAGNEDSLEWENAGSLMSQEGLELFRKFYDDKGQKFRTVLQNNASEHDLDTELKQFLNIPSPDEIKALGWGLFESKKALQSRWRRLQRDYLRTEYMLKVHHHLAAERAQRVAQQQRKRKRCAQNIDPESLPKKRSKVRDVDTISI